MKTKIAAVVLTLAIALAGVFSFSGNAEAKKYYWSRSNFSVTGDGSNADASIVYVGGISTSTNHYRKASISGLRMANPFSYRVFQQMDPEWNFGEEAWNVKDRYFMTDGYLWFHYGTSQTVGSETTYSEYSTGNFRYFKYYGGNKKKKRSNSVRKTYEFAVSGTESDADATSRDSSSATTYYYRKVAVPEFETGNLADYRLYEKNDFPQGFDDESWMLLNEYFFVTDGYIYIKYGSKYGSTFTVDDETTYRLFIYSDMKRKKSRLEKQYSKKYAFSIPNDPTAADKVASYTDSDGYVMKEYYKKYPLKGAKIADFPNVLLIKKNNFASGYADESWSEKGYTISDGYLWVCYGYETIEPGNAAGTYEDSASGDYRIFVYK
jgi:hypothetical protein